MDNELFELCKQVYEKTAWKDTDCVWYSNAGEVHDRRGVWHGNDVFDKEANIPLYTSDYLLDKLQKCLLWQGANSRLELVPQGCQYGGSAELWCATCAQPLRSIPILEVADTPLKALLKLVSALDDAGVKLL